MKPTLRLDRNEYFFPHPESVLAALQAEEGISFSQYATAESHTEFQNRLGTFLDVSPSLITLGHGVEDLLIKILAWYRVKANTVVLADFSWANYDRIAVGLGYSIERLKTPLHTDGFATDLSELDSVLKKNNETKIVILAGPNNPTGHTMDCAELAALIQRHQNHYFLVDAVYDAPRSSYLKLGLREQNCVFLGSFSKFFGLPGLRVGYAVSKSLPSAFGLALGLQPTALRACTTVMDHETYYAQNRSSMLESAEMLKNLNLLGIRVFSSQAPFVLMEFTKTFSASQLQRAEETAGVRPKYFSHGGKNYMRWGLGPVKIVERIKVFLSALNS